MEDRTGSLGKSVSAKKVVGTSKRETEDTLWIVTHYEDGSSVETPYLKDLDVEKYKYL